MGGQPITHRHDLGLVLWMKMLDNTQTLEQRGGLISYG